MVSLYPESCLDSTLNVAKIQQEENEVEKLLTLLLTRATIHPFRLGVAVVAINLQALAGHTDRACLVAFLPSQSTRPTTYCIVLVGNIALCKSNERVEGSDKTCPASSGV